MRIMAEAKLNEDNAFVTLTYSDEQLPEHGGLVKRDCQLFMKRLRKTTGAKIRYFLCGEYGDSTFRPHYHAALFGYQFPDLELLFTNANGDRLFTSELCDRIWGKGHCTVGHVQWESAGYIAGYVTKKQTGKNATIYESLGEDGELLTIEPPFALMSRRPGLGREWYDRFKTDCYPNDYLVHENHKMQPPKYFEKILERENPDQWKAVKLKRLKHCLEHKPTSYQLMAKDKITNARIAQRKGKI